MGGTDDGACVLISVIVSRVVFIILSVPRARSVRDIFRKRTTWRLHSWEIHALYELSIYIIASSITDYVFVVRLTFINLECHVWLLCASSHI